MSPNPGPSVKCKVCLRMIARNHRAVLCDSCKGQSHIKCVNIKPSKYKRIQQSSYGAWTCPTCIGMLIQNELPFNQVDNSTFENLFMDASNTVEDQVRENASETDEGFCQSLQSSN